MSVKDSAAVSLAPLFLRVALGVTFLWAGLGKVVEEFEVKGAEAATLANLGVLERRGVPTTPSEVKPEVKPETKPETKPEVRPEPRPELKPESKPAPAEKPVAPKVPEPKVEEKKPPKWPDPTGPLSSGGFEVVLARVAGATAGDYPEGVKVRRVYGLTLLLVRASGEEGLWPRALAQDHWPVTLAWAAAVTEIACGAFVLVGLFTRFSAFWLGALITAAAWLTQIGPSLRGGGGLGAMWEMDSAGNYAYATLLWQGALAMMSMSLVFLGSGALGFDRALFPPPPPAKPAGGAEKKV
jgi:uncharacterized membrane protein YphA (DoxX/SURF4 family)